MASHLSEARGRFVILRWSSAGDHVYAPLLLPLEELPLRRALNELFERIGVRPKVLAEFEDSALLKSFAADGLGLFPAPTVVAAEIMQQYDVLRLGDLPEVRERFYAISAERRLAHPAVVALLTAARSELFAVRRGARRK